MARGFAEGCRDEGGGGNKWARDIEVECRWCFNRKGKVKRSSVGVGAVGKG